MTFRYLKPRYILSHGSQLCKDAVKQYINYPRQSKIVSNKLTVTTYKCDSEYVLMVAESLDDLNKITVSYKDTLDNVLKELAHIIGTSEAETMIRNIEG